MTPITAASAISVVRPDTIISQRARAIMRAAAAFCSASSASATTGSLAAVCSAWLGDLPAAKLCIEVPRKGPMTSTLKSIRIADDEAGGRLDRVLATHIAELSRTRLKALIEAGAVAIDGRTIRDPGHRVNSGAAIEIDVPPPADAKPAPEPIPLNVVYEDADIIVI